LSPPEEGRKLNDYFDRTKFTALERGAKARASHVMAIIDAAIAGFDLLPHKDKLTQGRVTYSLDTGTADHYIATLDAAITGLEAGLRVSFKAANANTGASDLIAGGFLANLKKNIDDDLEDGDIEVGQIVDATYDGTNFQVVSLLGASYAAADLSEADAEAAAIAAAASAVTAAAAADNLRATSTTSLLIAVASKSFTTQAGKAFQEGGFVTAASDANPANYMYGQVTSYSGTSLVVNVTKVGGSGTLADWNISVSGAIGAQGPAGTPGAGSGDVLGPGPVTSGRIAIFDGTSGDQLGEGSIPITAAMELLAGQTPAADSMPIYTAADAIGFLVVPANSQSLLTAANYTAMLALLGLTIPANGRLWYSAGGVLASEAALAYDSSLNQVSMGQLEVDSTNGLLAAPTSPAVRYGAMIDSRPWPAMRTPDHAAVRVAPLQGSLWRRFAMFPFNNGGAPTFGSVGGGHTTSNSAVFSIPATATTNWRTRNVRVRATGLASAGNRFNFRTALPRWCRSATAGVGGFRTEITFALGVNTTGMQCFVGMCVLDTFLSGDASAQVDCFGLGYDAGDASSGNFFIIHNDGSGSATKVNTGIARSTSLAYRLVLECPVGNASTLYWHLTDLNSGTTASGSITTNLPAADVMMNFHFQMNNGAIASASILELYDGCIDSPVN
jgi:hypothetical protein